LRCAVGLPNVGLYGDPLLLVALAEEAEQAGWDGVFVGDHLLYHDPSWPVADPTVTAAAAVARTARVRLGVLVTAVPRRRPAKLAREVASLDVLSGGRLVFGAGLGSMAAEYAAFGEPDDLRARAETLDEALDLMTALWSGEPVTFHGRHLRADGVRMLPTPVQRPRVPVWCAGRWPARAPLRRAARWDGVMPTHASYDRGRPMPPGELRRVVSYVAAHRDVAAPFDVALEGATDGGRPDRDAATVLPYVDAGLTW
ncbi:MAG TPA: LLM class flavin-dependent oxidoreductase, partial [Frankiaceae bacterium]|nr:LLM class flavin-dependent oxidoreductase [Frankiaceae bacterium]